MIFLYLVLFLFLERKEEKKKTHEKLSNNNGNEFCKRHRSVGQKGGNGNRQYILYKIDEEYEKPIRDERAGERTKERMNGKKYACNIDHKMVEKS